LDVNLHIHEGKTYQIGPHTLSGAACTIYHVGVKCIRNSLFSRFCEENSSNKYHLGIKDIIQRLTSIGATTGAVETFFKYKQWKDPRVCYLYAEPGDLRMYCIRLSEKIIIIGGGGGKSVATWQEDDKLSEEVIWMIQVFEDLRERLKTGVIKISDCGYRLEGNLMFKKDD